MNNTNANIRAASRTDASGAMYAFARHETFHPRFGWIKKGFDAAANDPEIFSREDAHIQLGVGKNMGAAIKYWCSAFKVIESGVAENRHRLSLPTQFGRRLLGEEGWDQFLEDEASLWLLHWNLLKQPCQATAWRFAFDVFKRAEFSADDLFNEMAAHRDGLGLRISDSSLSKDVSCILRMYTEQPLKKQVNEETLDCPFVELGLIQPTGDARHYAFRIGSKPNLPAEVIVAAALDYVVSIDPNQRTISVAALTYGSGSPGLAFKLTESAICQAIEEVSAKLKAIALTDSAGLVQMSFRDDPQQFSLQVLDRYYAR